MRFLQERFGPDDVESEARRRLTEELGEEVSSDIVRLLSYHVCIKMQYSRITMINRFDCIPSMINTIEGKVKRIYNELLFCFDVHEIQKTCVTSKNSHPAL